MAEFAQAILLNPQYAVAYYNRGNSLFKLGRYQDAIVDYTQAIRLNPRYGSAYNNRGITYRQLGRLIEAERDSAMAKSLKN